jgi:rSAM/selenodomain-associated transferase 2
MEAQYEQLHIEMTSVPVRPKISVVIPTLNEASHIGNCLRSVREVLPEAEILVVDGGSTDETADIASGRGVLVLSAPRGRGTQCNEGGLLATGEIILFLHADTTLPSDAHELITLEFSDPKTRVAMFRLSFDDDHPLLRFYAFFTRFDSEWFKFGDQVIILRREMFWKMGGFRNWPLLEDVELLQRLRMITKIRIFPAAVTTSARRFRAGGFVRRQLRNGWILLRFFLGESPYNLAQEYNGESTSTAVRPLSSPEAERIKELGLRHVRPFLIRGNH